MNFDGIKSRAGGLPGSYFQFTAVVRIVIGKYPHSRKRDGGINQLVIYRSAAGNRAGDRMIHCLN